MDHNDEQNQSPPPITPQGPQGPKGSGYMKLAGAGDGDYDALADLFLGESELAPDQLPDQFSDQFSNTGTDAADPVPAIPNPPVQVMPGMPRMSRMSRMSIEQHVDDYFSTHQATATTTTATIPCIEAVLLGHLPVRASLWVRQYACSTARRRNEVVALIRAAAGSTSVDLISGNQTIESAQCDSLHQALASVNTIADRIILRVDETTEPELLDRGEIDEITILTGADEAAIVASYRLIKTITGVWDSDAQISPASPHLRLAVMGATGQQAADASTKLSRAVDAFLDRPIEIIDVAGRIDATVTTNIFRDAMAHQATQILDELIDIGCNIPTLNPPVPEPTIPEPILSEAPLPEPEPDPRPEPKPTLPNQTELHPLIQGLTKLETTCPFALEVELCVDAQGSLHLLTSEEHQGPLVRLETVRAWVRDHLPLILRAEPALAFPSSEDRSDDIDLHLITHDPQSVRGLIDSPVHIHVLAEIEVAGQKARVATQIN